MDPLGDVIAWAAPLGLAGLLAIGAMERIVPVLPSYGLLVAIGICAADGLWPVPLAILVVTLGSTAACLSCCALVRALGQARAERLLRRSTRLFGLSAGRLAQWVEGYRKQQALIAFGSQLVPTIRLMTPAIAGLLRADLGVFLLASAAGIAAWNGLFIGIGFIAAQLSSHINVSALAIKLLVALIVTEAVAILAWRRLRQGATSPTSFHTLQDKVP
jgi:membrane protein DedA with SNARE-associated domain